MSGQPQSSKERLGAHCAMGQGFYIPNPSFHSPENTVRYILKFQFYKRKGCGSDMFFMLSKVTQLVSGRARPETRTWLSTLSTPPLNWGWSLCLLFLLPHRLHQRTQHEKGHAFSFFYVLYLPPLHHRVPRKVLSKHACLEATPSSCCHKWGWDTKHGGAGSGSCRRCGC